MIEVVAKKFPTVDFIKGVLALSSHCPELCIRTTTRMVVQSFDDIGVVSQGPQGTFAVPRAVGVDAGLGRQAPF